MIWLCRLLAAIVLRLLLEVMRGARAAEDLGSMFEDMLGVA